MGNNDFAKAKSFIPTKRKRRYEPMEYTSQRTKVDKEGKLNNKATSKSSGKKDDAVKKQTPATTKSTKATAPKSAVSTQAKSSAKTTAKSTKSTKSDAKTSATNKKVDVKANASKNVATSAKATAGKKTSAQQDTKSNTAKSTNTKSTSKTNNVKSTTAKSTPKTSTSKASSTKTSSKASSNSTAVKTTKSKSSTASAKSPSKATPSKTKQTATKSSTAKSTASKSGASTAKKTSSSSTSKSSGESKAKTSSTATPKTTSTKASTTSKTTTAKGKASGVTKADKATTKKAPSVTKKDEPAKNASVDKEPKATTKKSTAKKTAGVVAGTAVAGAVVAGAVIAGSKKNKAKEPEIEKKVEASKDTESLKEQTPDTEGIKSENVKTAENQKTGVDIENDASKVEQQEQPKPSAEAPKVDNDVEAKNGDISSKDVQNAGAVSGVGSQAISEVAMSKAPPKPDNASQGKKTQSVKPETISKAPAKPKAPPKKPTAEGVAQVSAVADSIKTPPKPKAPPKPVQPLKAESEQGATKVKEAPPKPKKLKADNDNIENEDLASDKKQRIKKEKVNARDEEKAKKLLENDQPIASDKSVTLDDMNKKKEKGKKKWLWLLLLLLLLLLVVFLIWGRGLFEVPITYKVTPQGNVIVIQSPDEEIPVTEFRFMPGDTISFEDPLYLLHSVRNEDGEYNNMFTFRFKAYILCEEQKYNIVSAVNDGVDARLVKYRDYWYYQGIVLPNNEPVDILENIKINIQTTDNTLSGKTVQLVLELETVYPTEDQIYEKFGTFPGGWYSFVTVMYENYYSQGYR